MKKKILTSVIALSLSGIFTLPSYAVSNTLSDTSNTLSNTSNASEKSGFVIPDDIKVIDEYTAARQNNIKSGRITVSMMTRMSAESMVIEDTSLTGTVDFNSNNSHIKMASAGYENEMYVYDNVSYMKNPETGKWEKLTLSDIKTGGLSETLMEKPVIAELLNMEKTDDGILLKNSAPVPLKVYLEVLQGGGPSSEGMPEPEGKVDIEIKINKDKFIESIKIDIVSEENIPGGPSSMNINFLKTFKDFGTAPEIILPDDVKNAEEYNSSGNTPVPSSNTSNTSNTVN